MGRFLSKKGRIMVNLKVPSNFVAQQKQKQVSFSESKKLLQVMFYKPPPSDPFINRAVAWIDGPFSHVEIGFEDGMASSIYSGERVFMHPRTFSNPNYTIVSIPVTGFQEQKAREFCTDHALKGIEFDGVGMYTARLPGFIRYLLLNGKTSENKTFCSKYVVQVMQHIGVDSFMDMDPSATSPSMVHRVLKDDNLIQSDVLGTTPYRRNLLETQGIV